MVIPTIKMTSPQGGRGIVFQRGGSGQTLLWTSTGNISDVSITLSNTNPAYNVAPVTLATVPNTGLYQTVFPLASTQVRGLTSAPRDLC